MTIVPFPNNFEIYFQNAMDALMSGNFEEAVAFIDKALAIKMDDELFNIGVSLLQSQNQAENALYLITKYQESLYNATTVEEMDLLLITLLIDAGKFSEAEKQINQRWAMLKNKAEYAYLENVLAQYLERITEEKKRQTEIERDEIVSKSQSISQEPYFKQVAFVKSLSILTNDDFETLIGPLLSDEAVHSLIKTELLNHLSERSSKTAFSVTKHGITDSVVPIFLDSPVHSTFYLEGLAVIEEVKGHNIIEKQNLEEVLLLHTLYFYPFEHRFFQDSTRWLQAITHPGEDSEYDFYINEVEKGLDLLT